MYICIYMYIYISLSRTSLSRLIRCDRHLVSVCVLCGSPVWPSPPVVGPLCPPPPLCGSPVWVPCAGPLCGSPVQVPSLWVPCVGPSSRCVHVASTRVMSPAHSHAPALLESYVLNSYSHIPETQPHEYELRIPPGLNLYMLWIRTFSRFMYS